jgi:hypothetical protein
MAFLPLPLCVMLSPLKTLTFFINALNFAFDRFATNYNRKCDSFNSKFWCSGTSGIDALRFSWSSDNNWLVPSPCLVIETVNKLTRENATDGYLQNRNLTIINNEFMARNAKLEN